MSFKTLIREKHVILKSLGIVLVQWLLISCAFSNPAIKLPPLSGPVVIDHKSTDLDQIPKEWINKAQSDIKWHYAHTSHGNQLLTGLQIIMDKNPDYAVSIGKRSLPRTKNALCVFDGQNRYLGVTPENYWQTAAGKRYTQEVIEYNPINVSMWSWCGQAGTYTEEEVQEYLDAMAAFQEAYPEVTFIYMTGQAQQGGKKGYNRYLRNNQIRKWVKDHPEKNRVLFDFADLDSWWYNPVLEKWEQSTYRYSDGTGTIDIPIEHPRFHGRKESPNYACHTTHESCEQKAKAVWWMMARLAGWKPNTPE